MLIDRTKMLSTFLLYTVFKMVELLVPEEFETKARLRS